MMPLADVRLSAVRIVVFDMFGTLVRNEVDAWIDDLPVAETPEPDGAA